MSTKIIYSKQALKFLRKLDKPSRVRILLAIEKLPQGDIKKLVNKAGFRLRVGDYRVIFDKDGNIIEVLEIGNRGEIYK